MKEFTIKVKTAKNFRSAEDFRARLEDLVLWYTKNGEAVEADGGIVAAWVLVDGEFNPAFGLEIGVIR